MHIFVSMIVCGLNAQNVPNRMISKKNWSDTMLLYVVIGIVIVIFCISTLLGRHPTSPFTNGNGANGDESSNEFLRKITLKK